MQADSDREATSKVFSGSRRLIALDIYDGPVRGVLYDLDNNQAWRFTMIDWDDQQEVRIFAMAPLAQEAFDQIVGALSQFQPPQWPRWFPMFNYPNNETEQAVERQIEDILASASGVSHVIAMSGWGDTILAERSIETNELPPIQAWDSTTGFISSPGWLELFGFERSPKE